MLLKQTIDAITGVLTFPLTLRPFATRLRCLSSRSTLLALPGWPT
jgi:hypothetical protein